MTEMRHLDLRFDTVHYKALTKGEPEGTFEAIGALFGNIDRAKERLQKGSLEESINKSLPAVVWSHDWLTPPVGVTIEMAELDRAGVERLSGRPVPETVTGGLYGKGRFFVDPDEGEVPLARHIYTAMRTKGGDGQPALREWSVGLNVKRESYEEIEGNLIVNLEQCDLPEWGPCLKGVNPNTFTVGTKADDIKRLITKGVLDPEELKLALDLTPDNHDGSDLKKALPVTHMGFTDRDRPWSGPDAKKNVHEWAKKDDGSYDASKLQRAYLWLDDGADPKAVTSYRFIVSDLVNGTLKYVPKGIFAAAGVLNGARGGTTIGDDGIAALRKSIDGLYARMRKEFDDDSIETNWKAQQPDRRGLADLLLV